MKISGHHGILPILLMILEMNPPAESDVSDEAYPSPTGGNRLIEQPPPGG